MNKPTRVYIAGKITGETLNFRKNFKSGEYIEDRTELTADNWEILQFPKEENKTSREDIFRLEMVARKNILKQIENQVKFSQCIEKIEGDDFPSSLNFKKEIIELLERIF